MSYDRNFATKIAYIESVLGDEFGPIGKKLYTKCNDLYDSDNTNTQKFVDTVEELTKLMKFCKVLDYKIDEIMEKFNNAVLRSVIPDEKYITIRDTNYIGKSCLKKTTDFREDSERDFEDTRLFQMQKKKKTIRIADDAKKYDAPTRIVLKTYTT